MRFFNPKKLEFYLKNLFQLSDAFLLKKRANRYLRKNTEKEIRILKKLVTPSRASIDIGVYRGIYSFFLTDLSSFVYAFEANPLLYSKIQNSFKNKKNIKIENIAISSSIGEAELRIPLRDINADYDYEQKYRLGTATIHNVNNLENKHYETIKKIKTISLDEYSFRHEIGFVKIDVEGHELDIIKGGKKFILKNKPVMLIEIEKRHSGIDPQITIDEVKSLGYQCLYVNDEFELKTVSKVEDISNNNFVFIPE
tara:strand:+ start:1058 stop:1819 length:762 start_codon:yes stop_codon:yes gene_type:complete